MVIEGVRLPWRGVLAAILAMPVLLAITALILSSGPS